MGYHLCQRITEANHKLCYYFTMNNVLELLAERKIHRTARVSHFARPPLQSVIEMAKKPQGSGDNKLALIKRYDNRPVIMASDFVGVSNG